MNFTRKRSLCVIAFALVINFAVISGNPLDDHLQRGTEVTTETDGKTTSEENDESTPNKTKTSPTSSSSSTAVKSTTAELPLDDEPAKEPNSDLPPEVAASSPRPKETTSVPPLIHYTETSPGPMVITTSSTTTTALPSETISSGGRVHDSTVPTPSSTTKKPNSATGLHAAQFTCFVASAMLVLLR